MVERTRGRITEEGIMKTFRKTGSFVPTFTIPDLRRANKKDERERETSIILVLNWFYIKLLRCV